MMSSVLKFLTLNLCGGYRLEEVVEFLLQERFDLIHLQEVSGGVVSFDRQDCFEAIKEATGLKGELILSWAHKDPSQAYFGNATFYSPRLALLKRKELRFKPFQEFDPSAMPPIPEHPRSALFLSFDCEGKRFWSINTHLAWGPTPEDEPYKVEDAKKLAQELEVLSHPPLLSGDFNVISSTEVVKTLEKNLENQTVKHQITNTLNPELHRAKHLFPSGYAVDYIMNHPKIEVEGFSLVDKPPLSDHFGLRCELILALPDQHL